MHVLRFKCNHLSSDTSSMSVSLFVLVLQMFIYNYCFNNKNSFTIYGSNYFSISFESSNHYDSNEVLMSGVM